MTRVAPSSNSNNTNDKVATQMVLVATQRPSMRRGLTQRLVNNVAGDGGFAREEGSNSIAGLASIMGRFRAHRQQRRHRLGKTVQFAGMGLFFFLCIVCFLFAILLGLGLVAVDVCVPLALIAGVGMPAGFMLLSMADIDIDTAFNERTPKLVGCVWTTALIAGFFWAAVKAISMLA